MAFENIQSDMYLSKYLNHFNVYNFGLILLIVSLPVSVFTMSVAQFILAINWIWEGGFRRKFHDIKIHKSLWLFLLIYIVHLLGLIHTSWPDGFSGTGYNAFTDIRVKLPLLILPVIISTSPALNPKQIKYLLMFFIASVFVATIISTAVLFGAGNHQINDIRDISLFISHIRFALLVNISVFILGHFLIATEGKISGIERFIYIILIIWLVVFLILLQSLTGIAVLIICSAIFMAIQVWKMKKQWIRLLLFIGLIGVPLLLGIYLVHNYLEFKKFDSIDKEELNSTTMRGNTYYHDLNNPQVENGHWVGLFICEKELKEEWNKLSTYEYGGLDDKGQKIKYTLIRYLTSLGYRKDAEGIKKLNTNDVSAIESGLANHKFQNKFNLHTRIYQTIWEIDLYFRDGSPNDHSVAQRIEYMKAAFSIIKRKPVFGVGTGDAQSAFNNQYDLMQSKLHEKNRHRAHNQFITFIVTFGFVGFLIILAGMLAPIIIEKKAGDFYFMMFFIVAIVSMLNEDTLETQAGISFFTFFYSLFLFGRR